VANQFRFPRPGNLSKPKPPQASDRGATLHAAVLVDPTDSLSVLMIRDRMGSRVERVAFAWERGKVLKP
jgi:hypothetical protein